MCQIAAALGATLLVASGPLIVAVILTVGTENKEILSEWDNAPQTPQFNSYDNAECRQVINVRYESASRILESAKSTQAKLDKYYSEILDRQEKYGIELVNNSDFRAFTLSDWE